MELLGDDPMDDERLRKFAALIRQESRLRSGKPIATATPEQATIVLEALFSSANEQIRIVTGRLNARIYGNERVIVEAKKFLADKRHTLKIVFLAETDSMILPLHPLLAALRHNNNLDLMQALPEIRNLLPYHFCIADQDAYRFKEDANSHGSVTAFGDCEFAAQLLKVFTHLERSSERLQLREMA